MSLLKKSLLEQQLFVKKLIEETRLVSESGSNDEVFQEPSNQKYTESMNLFLVVDTSIWRYFISFYIELALADPLQGRFQQFFNGLVV